MVIFSDLNKLLLESSFKICKIVFWLDDQYIHGL